MKVHASDVPVEDGALKVLRQRVREVVLALDLDEGKVAGPQPILNPEVGHVQVTHAAEPLPAADANRGTCVRAQLQGPGDAEVRCDGLKPKASRRRSDNPAEFGFCGAEAHCALCS